MSEATHRRIICPDCNGAGGRRSYYGNFWECGRCRGCGKLTVYPNRRAALWPGGPFAGQLTEDALNEAEEVSHE